MRYRDLGSGRPRLAAWERNSWSQTSGAQEKKLSYDGRTD